MARLVRLPLSLRRRLRFSGNSPDDSRESTGHRPDDGGLPLGGQGDRIELVGCRARPSARTGLLARLRGLGCWISRCPSRWRDHGIEIIEVVVVPLGGAMWLSHLRYPHPEACGGGQWSSPLAVELASGMAVMRSSNGEAEQLVELAGTSVERIEVRLSPPARIGCHWRRVMGRTLEGEFSRCVGRRRQMRWRSAPQTRRWRWQAAIASRQ